VGVRGMEWLDYMEKAAQHSRNDAKLWFRYLRKYIDKCGSLFSMHDVESLFHSDVLTPFQRVSIRAAFDDDSQTRQHIVSLNQKANLNKIALIRGEYKNNDTHK
jgi:hypothetical protein